MRYAVLGPLVVTRDGRPVPISAGKLRVLLATLLMRANRPVTAGVLAERLWGEDQPADPRRSLQVYVTRLRDALADGGAAVRTEPGGYRIIVSPGDLDLAKFDALLVEAEAADNVVREAELLREALGLWRGAVCEDVPSPVLHDRDGRVVTERRLAAVERRIDLDLAAGRHAQLVAELAGLTAEHPFRERLWAQHMIVLYRSGRQADAIAAYWTLTRRLADELGADPGPALREVYQRIVAADPALDPVVPGTGEPERTSLWSPACQLPAETLDLVGRDDAARTVIGLLCGDEERAGVPVVVLSGPPGVGKSALAVAVAHRLRSRFPDGQWYVRLDGASAPRDVEDVLGELLVNSGLAAAGLPRGLQPRATALRSRLADRRVLLVLDDAGTAAQVTPVVPGTAGSAVLVTSRADLPGLRVRHTATGFKVHPLGPDASAELLGRLLGGVVAAEPDAAADLAVQCGHLPLALRIAAANLAGRAEPGIAGYVEELRAVRLDGLAVPGEPDLAVRAAFDVAYAALEPEARRLFRLLGCCAGTDVTVAATAALLDAAPPIAGRLVTVLGTANLITDDGAGRFRFHDLIRVYAAELAATDPQSPAGWERLCRWYQQVADEAIGYEFPAVVRVEPPVPRTVDVFAGADNARAWLDAERANLVATIVRAAETGPYDVTWRLEEILRKYLSAHSRLHDWQTNAEAAGAAAIRAGNRLAEGGAAFSLAGAHQAQGRTAEALAGNVFALERYQESGFLLGEAMASGNLALTYADQGDARRAVDLLTRAAEIFRAAGMTWYVAHALLNLSRVDVSLGRLDAARDHATECLDLINTDSRNPAYAPALINRANALWHQGELDLARADAVEALRTANRRHESAAHQIAAQLHAATGEGDEALRHALDGVRISRDEGRPRVEAEALITLGDVHVAAGLATDAVGCLDQAVALAEAGGYQAQLADALAARAEARTVEGAMVVARADAALAAALAEDLGRVLTVLRAERVVAAARLD
ncbi:SARP family transcriptional regulator [Longispora fulva]|uniref:DNA-binding SARP family transcriptional activator/tetratricopeptide (TPR) repeat protein n=1 Tax=Longispora fulva TaxID=619741 RepID=A0A8J7KVW9_9ACTN|nr:BTAD domain-containing putative transcriptional regulator [Longispora fulva]MBG6135827.1 DNA-binding SARP family transcriptional activator/tetratricopeptide (TPR) repeat protein [Longispora fulva]GIG55929.1 SARP family transcriptional regulator [Longispora fulva]